METFYDIGKTKIKERYFVNAQNQKNGLYVKYDNRGLKAVEANYLNGKPNGLAKEYYLPGIGYPGDEKLKIEVNYKNGEKDGIEKEYSYIKDGKFDYDNGVKTLIAEVTYKAGKGIRYKSYFMNGKLKSDLTDDGVCKLFYENGKSLEEYVLKGGAFEGYYKKWYENGQLFIDGNKKEGQWFGEVKVYYENGKLKAKELYGDRDFEGYSFIGKSEYYDENGNLEKTKEYFPIANKEQRIKITNYKNTIKTREYNALLPERKDLPDEDTPWYGDFIIYNDSNGKIMVSGSYAKPKKDGWKWKELKNSIWKWYKEDGTIDVERVYFEGKPVGQWKLYYDKDFKEVSDEKNASFFREIEFNKDGSVNTEKNVIDYFITGEKQFEGKILSINPDVLDGKCTFYHKNGKIESVIIFDKGSQVKVLEAYDENGKKVRK